MESKALETLVNEQEIASIALINLKGEPHNTPVWTHYKDGNVYVFTTKSSYKVKCAQNNPSCMIAFNFGCVKGTVELINREDPEYMTI